MSDRYIYQAQGRNSRTLSAVIIVYGMVALSYLWLGAALWILALPVLATLPALWDIWANPAAGLSVGPDGITWHAGRRKAEVARGEIDCVRLDRSWDFAIRISVVLRSGRRLRLPYECTPPIDDLQAALDNLKIRTERHPFSIF